MIAYNKNATQYIGIQVKALSKRTAVPLGSSLEKVMGDFWIIVNNVAKEPNVFILLPEEVKSQAVQNDKDGRISYWLEPSAYNIPEFIEAWHKIDEGHLALQP